MTIAADESYPINNDKRFDFKATYFGQFTGFFIDCINSGEGFVCPACDTFPTDCQFWTLTVNDVTSPVGVSLVELEDGDVLKFEVVTYVPPTTTPGV